MENVVLKIGRLKSVVNDSLKCGSTNYQVPDAPLVYGQGCGVERWWRLRCPGPINCLYCAWILMLALSCFPARLVESALAP